MTDTTAPQGVTLRSSAAMSFGVLIVPACVLVADVFDQTGRSGMHGVAFGIINVGQSLGLVIGPLAGGMLYESLGMTCTLAFYSAGLLLVPAGTLLYILRGK